MAFLFPCRIVVEQVPRFAPRAMAGGSTLPDRAVREAIANLPFCDAEVGRAFQSIGGEVRSTAMRYSSAFGVLPRFPKRRDGRDRRKRHGLVSRFMNKSRWGGVRDPDEERAEGAKPAKPRISLKKQLYMGRSAARFEDHARVGVGQDLGPGSYNPHDASTTHSRGATRRGVFAQGPRFVSQTSCAVPHADYNPGLAAASFEQ